MLGRIHRGVRRSWLALLVSLLAASATGAEPGELAHIFYPRSACQSDHIQVQLWDAREQAWAPHPEHSLVPVESCQLEDPGVLLNGIRWRCDDPGLRDEDGWYVGLDIFDPAIVSSCEVGALAGAAPITHIHVSRPDSGAELQSESPLALVEGSIRMEGVEGTQYDVVIAIDRSADGQAPERRLEGQVAAARSWLRAVEPRLGAVRVGIVSFPDVEPYKPPAARVHAAPTADLPLLERALDNVLARGVDGDPAFLTGLAASLDLLAPAYEARNRPQARPRVIMGLDGLAPPATQVAERPDFAVRTRELAERAQRAGVRVHLFALAGLAEEPGPVARDFVDKSLGSFERVTREQLGTAFFASASPPVPRDLVILNPRTQQATSATLDARGHFRAEVPVLAGPNPLELVATSSDGHRQSLDWLIRYDDSLEQERRLAAERERMRLSRGKRLDVEAELKTLAPDPWGAAPIEPIVVQ